MLHRHFMFYMVPCSFNWMPHSASWSHFIDSICVRSRAALCDFNFSFICFVVRCLFVVFSFLLRVRTLTSFFTGNFLSKSLSCSFAFGWPELIILRPWLIKRLIPSCLVAVCAKFWYFFISLSPFHLNATLIRLCHILLTQITVCHCYDFNRVRFRQ